MFGRDKSGTRPRQEDPATVEYWIVPAKDEIWNGVKYTRTGGKVLEEKRLARNPLNVGYPVGKMRVLKEVGRKICNMLKIEQLIVRLERCFRRPKMLTQSQDTESPASSLPYSSISHLG